MSKPLVVVIPHQLGRKEAKRRLTTGIGQLRAKFGHYVAAVDETWTDDRLDLAVRAMGQGVRAGIDVGETEVRVAVELPWMLAMIAEKAKGFIRKEGTLLLEKKR